MTVSPGVLLMAYFHYSSGAKWPKVWTTLTTSRWSQVQYTSKSWRFQATPRGMLEKHTVVFITCCLKSGYPISSMAYHHVLIELPSNSANICRIGPNFWHKPNLNIGLILFDCIYIYMRERPPKKITKHHLPLGEYHILFKYLFGSTVEKGKYRKVPCWISLTWGSPNDLWAYQYPHVSWLNSTILTPYCTYIISVTISIISPHVCFVSNHKC